MKLTIAIPTYNRNRILADNLSVLLPQITEDCRIQIFDNHSETPVAVSLAPLLDAYPQAHCEITRNRVNVGANANVMHCIEACETEWLWIMGDDDTATSDAVSIIFRSMERHPEAFFFNYSTSAYPIAGFRKAEGLSGFIREMTSFSNALFISAGIYRIGAMRGSIRIGYQFAYSGAPHLAILMMALEERSRTCFSPEKIVIQHSPEEAEEKWPLLAHAAAVGTLFDLPFPASERSALAAKVLATFPTLEQIVMQLVLLAAKEKNNRNALYFYEQIGTRLYRFDRNPVRKAKRLLYRALLRFPRLGYLLVSLAYRATRKKAVSVGLLHDRFARM